MSHLVSAPAQQRQRRQARAVDMTKKRNAPAPVFVPEDLEPHEKECLLQTAVDENMLSSSRKVDWDKFWKLANCPDKVATVRQRAQRKVKRYLPAFQNAVDELRARSAALVDRDAPVLQPPSEEDRAQRRQRAEDDLARHAAMEPPVEVEHSDMVAVIYDRTIYHGLVKREVEGVAEISFFNGDADEVPLEELRLVAAGHGPLPGGPAAAMLADEDERGTAAGSDDVKKYLKNVMEMNDEDAEVDDLMNLPASKIPAALKALEGPVAALDFDAAVAGVADVEPCEQFEDPRLAPASCDAHCWDLGCGKGPISAAVFFYALAAGIVIGLFRCDIDPRRRATVTMDVRRLNYRELYRQIPPFFVFLTATCTALSNAAHVYRSPKATPAQRARRDMVISVLEWYVGLIEFLFEMNPSVLICLEFPNGRFNEEPAFAKLQAAGGGRLRAVVARVEIKPSI